MSTINPNTSYVGENKAGHTVFGKNVDLGKDAFTPGLSPDTLSQTVSDRVLGDDVDLGIEQNIPRSNAAIKDYSGSAPSGYAIGGVPTYGNGQMSTTLTWPTDDEQSGKGELTIFKPLEMVHKDYNNLAN